MPRAEGRAAAVCGAAELVADYQRWLAGDGRGSRCYRDAARAFLGRWPDPAGFAAEPLTTQLRLTAAQRPFLTYLMLHGSFRPGYRPGASGGWRQTRGGPGRESPQRGPLSSGGLEAMPGERFASRPGARSPR